MKNYEFAIIILHPFVIPHLMRNLYVTFKKRFPLSRE